MLALPCTHPPARPRSFAPMGCDHALTTLSGVPLCYDVVCMGVVGVADRVAGGWVGYKGR